MALEFAERGDHGQDTLVGAHASETLAFSYGVGQAFSCHADETWFVVEGFELGRAAAHKEIHDSFGFGSEVRERAEDVFFGGGGCGRCNDAGGVFPVAKKALA